MTTATEDLDEYCKHDITRRFCSLCNGAEDLQRRERDLETERVLSLPGWFPARYGGKCANCSEYFHPGTPISRSGNFETESGRPYLAMCCAPTEEE